MFLPFFFLFRPSPKLPTTNSISSKQSSRRKFLNVRHTSRTLRASLVALSIPAHTLTPPIISNNATAITDYTAFDATRVRSFSSPPRDGLKTRLISCPAIPNGIVRADKVLPTCWQHASRDQCPSCLLDCSRAALAAGIEQVVPEGYVMRIEGSVCGRGRLNTIELQ